jgi:hypothetical protein
MWRAVLLPLPAPAIRSSGGGSVPCSCDAAAILLFCFFLICGVSQGICWQVHDLDGDLLLTPCA